jgi:4-hydroxybenzoate polyprenyltransferase
VKNLLVFVPLVAAHRLLDADALRLVALTVAAFCLTASGIYVANDLLDVRADRLHPRKRLRPFAAGELSIATGRVMSVGLVAAGFALAALVVSWRVTFALALYAGVSTAYSKWLKRQPVTDVFVLVSLYVMRIGAGALAASVMLSAWLIAFALFFFVSLAFVKRYTEASANAGQSHDGAMPGRGYAAQDALWMQTVGTSAGYMAVLVLALYVNGPDVSALYTRPRVLLLLCPVLLYWVSRVWFRAGRGLVHDDPVVEALRDPISYGAGAVSAAVLLAAL